MVPFEKAKMAQVLRTRLVSKNDNAHFLTKLDEDLLKEWSELGSRHLNNQATFHLGGKDTPKKVIEEEKATPKKTPTDTKETPKKGEKDKEEEEGSNKEEEEESSKEKKTKKTPKGKGKSKDKATKGSTGKKKRSREEKGGEDEDKEGGAEEGDSEAGKREKVPPKKRTEVEAPTATHEVKKKVYRLKPQFIGMYASRKKVANEARGLLLWPRSQ